MSISQVVVHENYTTEGHGDDIALLGISMEVTYISILSQLLCMHLM